MHGLSDAFATEGGRLLRLLLVRVR